MRAAAVGDSTSIRARAMEAAIAWADAEDWNPGLDDGARFATADPFAFFATEQDGQIVATASCTLYGDAYSFFGFYIVRPDLRGRGVGSALLDRALARAGTRVVGLDGVLEQQAYYERRAFVLAHRNVRWRMRGGRRPPGLTELASVRPLFADNEEVAQTLLAGLLATTGPETDVFVDIPEANPRAESLRAARDMEPAFETVRMYRNGRPAEDTHRVFGVTTFEFG
jgi:GNAT superfamily N-acetyltransferase